MKRLSIVSIQEHRISIEEHNCLIFSNNAIRVPAYCLRFLYCMGVMPVDFLNSVQK